MSENKEYKVSHQVSGTPFIIKHVSSLNNNVEEVDKNDGANQYNEFKYEVRHQVSGTPFTVRHTSYMDEEEPKRR